MYHLLYVDTFSASFSANVILLKDIYLKLRYGSGAAGRYMLKKTCIVLTHFLPRHHHLHLLSSSIFVVGKRLFCSACKLFCYLFCHFLSCPAIFVWGRTFCNLNGTILPIHLHLNGASLVPFIVLYQSIEIMYHVS